MTCPRCGGTGTIPVFPGGGFALNPGNRPERYEDCPRCQGTGTIDLAKEAELRDKPEES